MVPLMIRAMRIAVIGDKQQLSHISLLSKQTVICLPIFVDWGISQALLLSEEGTVKKYFIVRQEGKRQVQREIDFAKRFIFIDKIAKNAIKTMTFDRKLGILTQFSNLLLFLHT